MILAPPSLPGPSNWDLPLSAGALYTPFIQYSNRFTGEFTDFSWNIQQ
jgi:hypothetical protein